MLNLSSLVPMEVWTSKELWSAIFGSIIGSISAGAITIWAQSRSHKLAMNQSDKLELAKKQTIASQLLFKVVRLHSNVANILDHYNLQVAHVSVESHIVEPWAFVRPFANPSDRIVFSSDEMALLFTIDDDEVFQLISSLDALHNGIVDSTTTLHTLISTLRERLPVSGIDGEKATTDLNQDQALKYRPKMIDINMLFDEVYDRLHETIYISDRSLKKLSNLYNRKLRTNFNVENASDHLNLDRLRWNTPTDDRPADLFWSMSTKDAGLVGELQTKT